MSLAGTEIFEIYFAQNFLESAFYLPMTKYYSQEIK